MDERLKKYVDEVIAPKLHVRLQGECSKCAIVPRCMSWIEEEIKRDLGIDVTVFAERKKPFFWDTI